MSDGSYSPGSQQGPVPPVRCATSKPTAVIADDQASFSSIVTRLLQREFDILAATRDGVALLAAIERHHPDLVVADINMPLMNGIDAVSRARAVGSLEREACEPTAVVFLTNHDDQILLERAIAAGGLGYVLKPRAAVDLLVAVAAARQGRRFVSPPLEDPAA
ncbi:MAG: response regulator [Acidobacteria bacterium]|nr:response regulator [Acidobacteriota bacterium]